MDQVKIHDPFADDDEADNFGSIPTKVRKVPQDYA